ncbi:MAG TPA: hypothetical protein VH502_15550 [Actinoplanes sp.]|jgi:hypothetical protein
MDALDQVMDTAGSLLRRVDDVLSGLGAPPDHEVWAEIRRVRLLPGDAAQAVAALRAGDLDEAVPELRADARGYADIAEALPPPGSWSGEAADAYDAARRRTAEHLSGGPDSLDERLEATADLADALIDWVGQTRADLARLLAEVLGSTEVLSLSSDTAIDPAATGEVMAAADVGRRILQTVADSYEVAADLLQGSADLTTPARPS